MKGGLYTIGEDFGRVEGERGDGFGRRRKLLEVEVQGGVHRVDTVSLDELAGLSRALKGEKGPGGGGRVGPSAACRVDVSRFATRV